MASQARRVIIASPSHDGRCEIEYAYSLAETIRLCTQVGIEARPLILPGEALVQKARNELVRDALAHNFNDLIFIDSDQEWNPEWVLRLLRYPVDCVGGAVIMKTDETERYNVKAKSLAIPVHKDTGLMVVDGLGTGFLRLSAKAMQALWDASPEYVDDYGKRCRMMFDIRIENGRFVSEDMGIAAKLQAAGIQVHLDPTITCAHVGRKKYTGDFASYLHKLQAAVAAA